MTHIITTYISKGGTGKTTVTKNLAALSVLKNKRVLILDLDTNGHIATALKYKESQFEYFLQDWLMGRKTFEEIVMRDETTGVDFIPSNNGLNEVEVHIQLQQNSNRPKPPNQHLFLKNKIDKIKHLYDYIFIDTHPSGVNNLVPMAVIASTKVLIPVRVDEKDEKQMIESVEDIQGFVNSGYEMDYYVIPNAVDLRSMKEEHGYLLDTLNEMNVKNVSEPIRYSTAVGKNSFKVVDLTKAPSAGAKKIISDYEKLYQTVFGGDK
ncbi:ParA family protein [Priestia aryabhattai]|uniref:ParA family protein n=1 Tax=Priestia aryabhattai TaxID=412384 RepID=UPI003D2D3AFF